MCCPDPNSQGEMGEICRSVTDYFQNKGPISCSARNILFSPLLARSLCVNLQEAWVNITAALPALSASTQSVCHLNVKALHLHPTYSSATKTEAPYFTGSQDSRSKPLWIDCAMEDSIRSTYLTTRGAYRSCRCLWNFPLHRWSMQKTASKRQTLVHLF